MSGKIIILLKLWMSIQISNVLKMEMENGKCLKYVLPYNQVHRCITHLKVKQAWVVISRWPRGVPQSIEKDCFDLLFYFLFNSKCNYTWLVAWVIPIIPLYSTLDCGNFWDIFAEFIKTIPNKYYGINANTL